MRFKAIIPVVLILTPILSLLDIYPGQAQSCCRQGDRACRNRYPRRPTCQQRCSSGTCPVYGSSTYGGTWIPAELLAQINELIARKEATVGDYLLLAYDAALKKNFSSAESLYTQALELAKQNNDLDGQAASQQGLGGVYAALGKTADASRQLQNAGEMYTTLGNQQRLADVQLQLKQLSLPIQLQIPSNLRFPTQLQIPSELQTNPSRLQVR